MKGRLLDHTHLIERTKLFVFRRMSVRLVAKVEMALLKWHEAGGREKSRPETWQFNNSGILIKGHVKTATSD